MNIIGKKNIYFLISIIVIIPGLVSILLFGMKQSIDFTGGSRFSLVFPKTVTNQTTQKIQSVFKNQKIEVSSIQKSDKNVFIRTAAIEQKKHQAILDALKKRVGTFKEQNYESIGPTVGAETTLNAIKSVVFASILIVLYIAWSFRKVPKPASSIRFGICAVIALIHDVLVVVGIFSLLGHFFGVEIDSLFVTAVLTVIGFSVHDTIVVFDRIRENLKRMPNSDFATVVNDSILQTFGRSLNTSLTVIVVLFTLLLFGGETIRWFVVALLVGIISGTYSSIFNAAPLLVLWQEWEQKRKQRNK